MKLLQKAQQVTGSKELILQISFNRRRSARVTVDVAHRFLFQPGGDYRLFAVSNNQGVLAYSENGASFGRWEGLQLGKSVEVTNNDWYLETNLAVFREYYHGLSDATWLQGIDDVEVKMENDVIKVWACIQEGCGETEPR